MWGPRKETTPVCIRDSTTLLSLVYAIYPIAAQQMPAVIGRRTDVPGPYAASASELPNTSRGRAHLIDEVMGAAPYLRDRTRVSIREIRRTTRRIISVVECRYVQCAQSSLRRRRQYSPHVRRNRAGMNGQSGTQRRRPNTEVLPASMKLRQLSFSQVLVSAM